MRISEIFRSLQGEGRLTGTECAFVRACGCNLRCGYCDTLYASWSPEGVEMPVAEILERIEQLAIPGPQRHVVLTGGEPMLFDEMVSLSLALRNAGWHITVETSGTRYLPVACDLMSISPKLSNSTPVQSNDPRILARHEENRREPNVIERLIADCDYQFKFVVETPADCREVEEYLAARPQIDRRRAMLMPQGVDPAELEKIARWLEPYCAEHRLMFCPRKQIEWFGARRGT
ncbi:MAG: 7-carboxy-7-deazaguanine synthase QueE [Pirellulales bacterium]|nr:7-carboxy-7-deazaguanine synthase QueE [Pirellulales bacterium]